LTEDTVAPVATDDPTTDRRGLLRRPWTALAAVLGGAAVLASCDITSAAFDPEVHLLRRLTYGANPAARDGLRAVGAGAWLDRQLAPAGIDTGAVDAKLAAFPALAMTAQQLYTAYPDNASAQLALGQLRVATLVRAVESPAQLQERMVEFWNDHFNVNAQPRVVALLKVVEDREVMRRYALGRFKDLLLADASSPAMLMYLDNHLSKAGAINENYGRELLELHTLGHDNGYVYDDIVNTARLFTGWTVDYATGTFRYRPANHDTGPITIMGWTRPDTGSGYDHGVAFLSWLAMRPQTAQHVCRKLAVRFVSDDPDPALVDAMVSTWLANDSAVAPVLRTMVSHPAFAAAAEQKFHRPWDYLAFALRALDARLTVSGDVRDYLGVSARLGSLGQVPFAWPAPNGYPDTAADWLGTGGLLARWNLAGDLVAGAFPPLVADLAAMRSSLAGRTAAEIYDAVSQAVMLQAVTGTGRDFLAAQTGWATDQRPSPAEIDAAFPVLLVAILASPDAQYR
jgi:uncharacterized protein (DUF1800 family)